MIKLLIHLSDIHLRTYQYHDLYEEQFNLFINDINNKFNIYNFDEKRIVITGDLFHQKINISNEQLIIMSNFIKELSTICKVIIIPGNHDFLENNMSRLDSITPMIEMLNDDNIIYYKNSGVYNDDNINWVVYSLYQHNKRPTFEKEKGKTHVGLFHGPIQGLKTDTGYEFEDDGYNKLNFIDLDLLLCGDIHKRQTFKLNNGAKGVMIGSFIQQNYGESINHHGYGSYDVLNDDYQFHDLKNTQPFIHFEINDITDIENGNERTINLG